MRLFGDRGPTLGSSWLYNGARGFAPGGSAEWVIGQDTDGIRWLILVGDSQRPKLFDPQRFAAGYGISPTPGPGNDPGVLLYSIAVALAKSRRLNIDFDRIVGHPPPEDGSLGRHSIGLAYGRSAGPADGDGVTPEETQWANELPAILTGQIPAPTGPMYAKISPAWWFTSDVGMSTDPTSPAYVGRAAYGPTGRPHGRILAGQGANIGWAVRTVLVAPKHAAYCMCVPQLRIGYIASRLGSRTASSGGDPWVALSVFTTLLSVVSGGLTGNLVGVAIASIKEIASIAEQVQAGAQLANAGTAWFQVVQDFARTHPLPHRPPLATQAQLEQRSARELKIAAGGAAAGGAAIALLLLA